MNNPLEKLTIIIPTNNRNYYLSRCLLYHAQYPYGKIIVADSSNTEKKESNQTTIDTINRQSKSDIQYICYKPEREPLGGDIYQKWADALYHADTEYSQIVTDKEFSIPDGQKSCINYLEAHQDTALCEGEYYYIESQKPKRYTIRNMYPSKTPLLDNDAFTRLNSAKYGKNKTSNQMGIRRTAFHKSLYRTLESANIDDLRFGEFSLEFLTIIRSKTMYLETPYCYRDICNTTTKQSFNRVESSSLRYPNLNSYISQGIYDEYLSRFVTCLTPELLSNSNHLDPCQAEQFIKNDLIAIARKRGFFENEKLTQNPLWYLWRHSPYWLKKIGGKLAPKNILDLKSVTTPSEKIITKIIANTSYEHNNDISLLKLPDDYCNIDNINQN